MPRWACARTGRPHRRPHHAVASAAAIPPGRVAWQRAGMRSCFVGLADGLRDHLAPGSDLLILHARHRQRIAGVFASQPDLPLDQDSLAGFLHGFLVAGAHLVPPGGVQQQAMFPVLGATVLLARTLPINPGPATRGRRFIGRLALTLPPEEPADTQADTAVAAGLVTEAFEFAGDVPITCASLGGFCLGVLYTAPWLPEDTDPVPLLAAACRLALRLR